MIYNLATELDRQRFRNRCEKMLDDYAAVELTEKVFRSTSQNRYLHLLLGVVAMETGNSLEHVKLHYFKELVNPEVFVRTVDDPLAGPVRSVRSSAEVSKEEMSLSIDRFKRWANDNGFYMPEPTDIGLLRDIEIEMSKHRMYL